MLRNLLACLLLLTVTVAADSVVIVSVDGLAADFYQDRSFQAPTLRKLAREGLQAGQAVGVFPSVTYPNHTTMVTGCYPARHGIVSNAKAGSQAWYWESRELRATPLWRAAEKAGLKTALLGWPVSVGARVDFLIPEIFHIPGVNQGPTSRLVAANASPGLMERLNFQVGDTYSDWDAELTRAAVELLRLERPDLLLIHLVQVDGAQHKTGPGSPETHQALARVDALLYDLVAELDPSRDTLLVVGDHGFQPYHTTLYPETLLAEAGYPEAVVNGSGGSAAVYGTTAVVGFLRQHYTVLERSELKRLGAFPRAACALLAPEDAVFKNGAHPKQVSDKLLGHHGHLPEAVPTGFLAWGRGVAPGRQLETVRLLDLAPTAAHLLRIDFSCQGHPIPLTEGWMF